MNRYKVNSVSAFLIAILVWGTTSMVSPSAWGSDSSILETQGEAAELVKKYPFRNSILEWGQSINAVGMLRSEELTWNPSYSWLFRFYPRYYATEKLYVRLKAGLGIEWTNADDTTTYREPRWEDLWLDFAYAPIYKERFTGIEVTPSLRLVIPTSPEAQAQSLYIGIGPGFALKRTFELPHRLTLELGYGFRYIKNLNHYTTVQRESPSLATCGGAGGEGDCGPYLHTGERVPSHEFVNSVSADLTFREKLKLAASVIFRNRLLYDLSPAEVAIGGKLTPVPVDPANNVGHRGAIWYLIEASYEVHPVISLGLSVSTLNPQLAEDSTYYRPFFNRYTEFGLTMTFAMDQIVARVDRSIRARRAARVAARE